MSIPSAAAPASLPSLLSEVDEGAGIKWHLAKPPEAKAAKPSPREEKKSTPIPFIFLQENQYRQSLLFPIAQLVKAGKLSVNGVCIGLATLYMELRMRGHPPTKIIALLRQEAYKEIALKGQMEQARDWQNYYHAKRAKGGENISLRTVHGRLQQWSPSQTHFPRLAFLGSYDMASGKISNTVESHPLARPAHASAAASAGPRALFTSLFEGGLPSQCGARQRLFLLLYAFKRKDGTTARHGVTYDALVPGSAALFDPDKGVPLADGGINIADPATFLTRYLRWRGAITVDVSQYCLSDLESPGTSCGCRNYYDSFSYRR